MPKTIFFYLIPNIYHTKLHRKFDFHLTIYPSFKVFCFLVFFAHYHDFHKKNFFFLFEWQHLGSYKIKIQQKKKKKRHEKEDHKLIDIIFHSSSTVLNKLFLLISCTQHRKFHIKVCSRETRCSAQPYYNSAGFCICIVWSFTLLCPKIVCIFVPLVQLISITERIRYGCFLVEIRVSVDVIYDII